MKANIILSLKKKKKAKACELALFINNLKKCNRIPLEFNEILFHHVVSKIIITKDGFALFHIKNGTVIKLII